jgi:hypothetical protein
VGFSEGLAGSALNAGNYNAGRRRFADGTMQHLWADAATTLEVILDKPDEGASLWFATRGVPFLHMDAIDEATVQSQEAVTITALVRDGFTHESAIDAVVNKDWNRLVPRLDDKGEPLASVQLQPAITSANGNGDPQAARAALLGGNQT